MTPTPRTDKGYPGTPGIQRDHLPQTPPSREGLALVALAQLKGRGYNDTVIVPWPPAPQPGYRLELIDGPLDHPTAATRLLARYAGTPTPEDA